MFGSLASESEGNTLACLTSQEVVTEEALGSKGSGFEV